MKSQDPTVPELPPEVEVVVSGIRPLVPDVVPEVLPEVVPDDEEVVEDAIETNPEEELDTHKKSFEQIFALLLQHPNIQQFPLQRVKLHPPFEVVLLVVDVDEVLLTVPDDDELLLELLDEPLEELEDPLLDELLELDDEVV